MPFGKYSFFRGLDWKPPEFAHIPLIHGPDGSKLSKRHGALGVEVYRDMGYAPEALCNYLLRLGWSHGDDEFIDRKQAIRWFDLDSVGQSPARIDFHKLDSLNAHYLRRKNSQELLGMILPRLRNTLNDALAKEAPDRILKGLESLKDRAKTINELTELAAFYALRRPIPLGDEAQRILDSEAKGRLGDVSAELAVATAWSQQDLESRLRGWCEREGHKLGKVAQPLRAALTGSKTSPGIFEVMEVLGKDETLGRIDDAISPV